jgi:hypothetical protein
MSLGFLNLFLKDFLAQDCSNSMRAIQLISKKLLTCIILHGIMNKLIMLIYNRIARHKQQPKAGLYLIAKKWYILVAKISTKN